MLEELNLDKNLLCILSPDCILSVFDHLHYERSDLDILSVPQRNYVQKKLKPYGYTFKTGRILASNEQDTIFKIPRQSIISANPFDIIKKERVSTMEALVLTPTQTACYLILKFDGEQLVQKLKSLISEQPVNLEKIFYHIKYEAQQESFSKIFNEIREFQKNQIKNTKLKFKSHL